MARGGRGSYHTGSKAKRKGGVDTESHLEGLGEGSRENTSRVYRTCRNKTLAQGHDEAACLQVADKHEELAARGPGARARARSRPGRDG